MAQSTPPPSPGPAGRNRRRHERIVLDGITLEVIRVGLTSRLPVSAATPAPNLAISLLDLSSGGFRVTTWGALAKGDRVVVKIKFPGGGKEISARAVVKRAAPVKLDGRDGFDVGCEFVDLDTNERIRLREMGKGGNQA
jgi:hypothetical protein